MALWLGHKGLHVDGGKKSVFIYLILRYCGRGLCEE